MAKRKVRKRSAHDRAVSFFYKHAGYSYDSKRETREQGKRKVARDLARAEAEAERRGWRVEWEEDPEPYQMGDAESETPREVLSAVLRDAGGKVLASLGGIGDPTREYARVVEAELALEALGGE